MISHEAAMKLIHNNLLSEVVGLYFEVLGGDFLVANFASVIKKVPLFDSSSSESSLLTSL